MTTGTQSLELLRWYRFTLDNNSSVELMWVESPNGSPRMIDRQGNSHDMPRGFQKIEPLENHQL